MMLLCTNNLHSLTKWRLRCNRALNVWQVVINKGILCNVLQLLKNKLLNYTTTVHHKESTISDNILYAFEKPNTIVSLCLDLKKKEKKKKGEQTTFQFTEFISSVLTMSCISYKIPKQSPYTPWQYKCSHNGKKTKNILDVKCHHSGVKNKLLGNGWTNIKSEHLHRPVWIVTLSVSK